MREIDDYEAQPRDGIMLSSHGNYGSTVFDPMDGNYLMFNLCDPCLIEAGEQGRVRAGRDSLPIQTDGILELGGKARIIKTIVGSCRLDRPLVQWTKDVPPDDTAPLYIQLDEIPQYYERDGYHWNLPLDLFAAMRAEVDAVDDE